MNDNVKPSKESLLKGSSSSLEKSSNLGLTKKSNSQNRYKTLDESSEEEKLVATTQPSS